MKAEKHGRGAEEAWEALLSFASVGVSRFEVTETDLNGRMRLFRPAQTLPTLQRSLREWIDATIRRQHNLIVRPRGMSTELVQLDDLGERVLERLTPCAFLTLATSAGNHQAWIAIQEGTPDLARRLRHGAGADPCASGATRLPGSINFKAKYAPDFPVVRILQASPQRFVTRAELEGLGLLAEEEGSPATAPGRVSPDRRAKVWPSYDRCVQGAPLAHGANRPDVSRADFTFCLIAIDWGWSVEETCSRLLQQSRKARESGEEYAKRTVQRAAAAVARRRLPNPKNASTKNA